MTPQGGVPPLICARCGDRIGVYEPLWVEPPDSSIHLSASLRLPEYLRGPSCRHYHRGCLLEDGPAAGD